MALYENVKVSIWSDDFADLSPEAKLIYLWSFTNPRCNMAGLYKVKPVAMALETGIEDLARPLAELELDRFVYYANPWIFIRSRIKHLHTSGEKIRKSILLAVLELPDGHPFIGLFIDEYGKNTKVIGESSKTLRELILKRDSKAKSGRPIDDSLKSSYTDTDTDTDGLPLEELSDPVARIKAAGRAA